MILAGRVVLILGYTPDLHTRLLRPIVGESLAKQFTEPSFKLQHELRVTVVYAVITSPFVVLVREEGKDLRGKNPVVLLFALARDS